MAVAQGIKSRSKRQELPFNVHVNSHEQKTISKCQHVRPLTRTEEKKNPSSGPFPQFLTGIFHSESGVVRHADEAPSRSTVAGANPESGNDHQGLEGVRGGHN